MATDDKLFYVRRSRSVTGVEGGLLQQKLTKEDLREQKTNGICGKLCLVDTNR